ncbi:unnamed protein product [Protopolystoma xenopodis]|uniref:Uncharacterized protein n=1 Tax=Protopolystoma xenopodis TaxID=117903 RepID=A0A3S4ZYQ2_9PLAT|nr:unnamed protein product [Protopolystoma xenopodis]
MGDTMLTQGPTTDLAAVQANAISHLLKPHLAQVTQPTARPVAVSRARTGSGPARPLVETGPAPGTCPLTDSEAAFGSTSRRRWRPACLTLAGRPSCTYVSPPFGLSPRSTDTSDQSSD